MTGQEREMAKSAVRQSVEGLKDWILLNFLLDDYDKKKVEAYAAQEIVFGKDDIDRISNPDHPANSDEANTFYVEWNSHHPQ